MADNLHPDTFEKPSASAHSRPRLRLSPFGKGLLAGVLISLVVWALLAFVLVDLFS